MLPLWPISDYHGNVTKRGTGKTSTGVHHCVTFPPCTDNRQNHKNIDDGKGGDIIRKGWVLNTYYLLK